MGRVGNQQHGCSSTARPRSKPDDVILSNTAQRNRAPRISEEQWSKNRDEICQKYKEDSLSGMMKYMSANRRFDPVSPNKRQYIYRLGIWKCRKYGVDDDDEGLPREPDEQYQPFLLSEDDHMDDSGQESSQFDLNPGDDRERSHTDTTTSGAEPECQASGSEGLHYKKKLAADGLHARGDYENAFTLYRQYHNVLEASKDGNGTLNWRLSIINCVATARRPDQVTDARAMVEKQIEELADEPSSQLFYRLLKAVGLYQGPDSNYVAQRFELNSIMSVLEAALEDGDALAELSNSSSLVDMHLLVLLRRATVEMGHLNGVAPDAPVMENPLVSSDLLHRYVMQQPLRSCPAKLPKPYVVELCVKWCQWQQLQQHDALSAFDTLWSVYAADTQACWATYCEDDLGISPAVLLFTTCHVLAAFNKGKQPASGLEHEIDVGEKLIDAFIEKYLELFADNQRPHEDASSQLQDFRLLVAQTLEVALPSQSPSQPLQEQLDVNDFSQPFNDPTTDADIMQGMLMPNSFQSENENPVPDYHSPTNDAEDYLHPFDSLSVVGEEIELD